MIRLKPLCHKELTQFVLNIIEPQYHMLLHMQLANQATPPAPQNFDFRALAPH